MSGQAAGNPAHVTDHSRVRVTCFEAQSVTQTRATVGGNLDSARSMSEPPCFSSRPSMTTRLSEPPSTNMLTTRPSFRLNLTDDSSVVHVTALPSPVPTEIDDPESQDMIEDLQRKGIKIRDFAYAPPYASSSSASDEAIPFVSTGHASPTSVPAPVRTTELFDPYRGLVEVDYRWTRSKRTYPVTGKTLRRLLDLGWLSADELSSRGHPMDISALEKFDTHRAAAKEANGGVEAFPWRPLGTKDTQPPTTEERRIMLGNAGGLWKQHDRMMMSKEAREEWRRKEDEEAEQKKREFEVLERERERQRERKRRGKRKMEEGADIDDRKQGPGDLANSSSKRIRLSPSDDKEGLISSQESGILPPEKQYPAPLHAYNPKLYPDAASIIEASSQSQPRPSFPPSGADTPPVDNTDTPPSRDDGDKGNTFHAQRLVHPKKGGLRRNQTFTEFF